MTFFHPIKDMCFSHNRRCGAQFPSKDMIVRLFLHETALSFPLSPLQSAEHTNIYLPGAQCQEDSSPEFLLHSLTKLVDAFLISRALLNTNCLLPGCRDTVFRCGRGRVMFWTQEQSLQRTKKKEGDRGLPGDRRERYISGIQDKEQKGEGPVVRA